MSEKVQYFCKEEDCEASLILPVGEDPDYYGWYQGFNPKNIWLKCPRHNPWVRHSLLGQAILEEARQRRMVGARLLHGF